MNFYFDNVDFSSGTGPNTFGYRLAQAFTKLGHNITNSENCDAHLAFIEQKTSKNTSSKLVQRLDGIWFKPEEFHVLNRGIKTTYQNSDIVIWQSKFDKKMTEAHWGPQNGKVIHNGIDLTIVRPENSELLDIRRRYEKIFVCSANWHRQKRLRENIALFLSLKEKYPDSCLLVMGSTPDWIVKHDDILYTGSIPHALCLEVYSVADWMIHLAWLDHCPNVVVEALSQNCPVICTDSGGTGEIVKNNGIIIPETTPYAFELTDYDNPYKLEIPSLELPDVSIDNSYLDIEEVAQKYVSVISGGM